MEKSIQEDIREIAHKTGERLREAKADKAQYTVTETQTHEFNVDGGEFSLFRTPKEAAVGADVMITDVWASMGQEEEKAVRVKAFQGYQINDELMALTNEGCMVQHCLPAHRGEEITAEVFEAHADEIFDEAENRLHAQKAVMYLLMKEKDQ